MTTLAVTIFPWTGGATDPVITRADLSHLAYAGRLLRSRQYHQLIFRDVTLDKHRDQVTFLVDVDPAPGSLLPALEYVTEAITAAGLPETTTFNIRTTLITPPPPSP